MFLSVNGGLQYFEILYWLKEDATHVCLKVLKSNTKYVPSSLQNLITEINRLKY